MITNEQVIEKIIDLLPDVENPNQLAAYLSDKYNVHITRQQVHQFQQAQSLTITHLLLREFAERVV